MLTCISTTRAHTKCVSAFWAHSGRRHFSGKFLYKVALVKSPNAFRLRRLAQSVCVCVCVLGTWGWPWISGAELLHLSWHLLWSRCTSVRGGKNCPIWQFRSSSWQHKYVTTCVSPYMPYVIVCATLHTYQLMLLQNMSYLPCRQNHLIVQEKILGWQGSWSSERMWAWMPDIDCQSNISGRGSLEIILVEIIQKNTAGFLSPKCCRYSHTYPLFLHKPMLEARKDWPMIDLADTLSVEHTSSG